MPLLDVSEVLDDPYFQDTLTLTTATIVVGDNGRSVETPVITPIVGVVQSDKGRNRILIAEGVNVVGSIEVHTRVRLTSGGTGREADQLTWNGRDYIVRHIDDYSRYGDGYICAYADLLPLDGGSDGQ